MNIHTDIVILGGGIAALQAARTLSKRFEVHVIIKSDMTASSSYRAQGGIAAAIADNDHTSLHIHDTFMAGEYHHHEENVKALVKYGTTAVESLIAGGFPVDRTTDGHLSLGLEGAHSRHRIIHAGGDATGKTMIDYYVNELPENVHIHPHEFAYELIMNTTDECCGVHVKTATGEKTYFASYIILATGGAGALYDCTSNCSNSYGDGIALAYWAGAAITDMEFVQFHPSLLYTNAAHGLISEAVRGAGGRFIDEDGKAVMEGRHPLGDLAPRHVTAYEMYRMRTQGKEVYIDISSINHFETRFPTITTLCQRYGINLDEGRIPIAPGSHFLMGGIIANKIGETTIPRLFAVGETACTGVHGANRLASNSLLEGLAFGELMAAHLVTYGTNQTNFLTAAIPDKNIFSPLLTKKELQRDMSAYAGIVRSAHGLEAFLKKLPPLDWRPDLCHSSRDEIEQAFMHMTAALIANAALARTETRGAHIREDFAQKNQEWEKQWIVFRRGSMKVRNSLYEHNQIKEHAQAIF